MGRLVRMLNGEVAIAYRYVATPTYTLFVADYASGATPPDGWKYYADDVVHEDFAPLWEQPSSAEDAYALGAIVVHNGTRYRSAIDGNVWVPGVSGWHDADSEIPAYIAATGAHDAYKEGSVVRHEGKVWRSLIDANVWAPGVSGWREIALIAPDKPSGPPAWVQPTGGHDAYALGARVTHKGKVWTSTVGANVWEPGVYGWIAD